MATEYRLSHTAAEIDRKLSKIDSLVERNELPTKISDLVNDFDFTTESYVKNYAQPKGEYALKSEIPDVPVISVNGKDGDVRLTASDVGALPDTTVIPTVPTNVSAFTNDAGYLTEHQSLAGLATESYVDGKIGSISIPDVAGQVAAHNVSDTAHSDIRDLVDGLTNRLNTLANSDDATLDQMSEVVAYIKSNKTLIENVTTNKVNVSDIINNLTTNISNKPLSAAQGVVLKGLIDAIVVPVNVSELNNDAGYLTDVPSEYVTETELNAKGYLTSYVETDPTVPAWAKSETKPVYTASEVGALPNTTHIPSTLSEMADDNTHRTVSDDEKSSWNAKANVADIPTKVSDLDNDIGYLTEHQSLEGLATESYVNTQIAAIPTPDVSGQISAHNTNTAAHSDIRTIISDVDKKLYVQDSTPVNPKEGALWLDTDAENVYTNVYVPVKGIDYWTEADQEAIVQQVIAALGTPVFGRVDENNNIILTGDLADGTYTIKYEDSEGEQTVIGTLNHAVVPEPTYTNLIPLSIKADGTPYVGDNGEDGYRVNYRIKSDGTEVAMSGYKCTGYIPAVVTDSIYFSTDMKFIKDTSNNTKFALYDSGFNHIGYYTTAGLDELPAQAVSEGMVVDDSGNLVKLTPLCLRYWLTRDVVEKIAYFRVATTGITENSIITVNEPIV